MTFEATDEVWQERVELVRETARDLAKELLYYGRKDDEELPVGMIEAAMTRGSVTAERVTEWFGQALKEALAESGVVIKSP